MNGQEKDDEIFSGAYTAEYWEYDSRIARRWNVDPITYPWQSPYACFNNNPIFYADPFGLEGEGKNDWFQDSEGHTFWSDSKESSITKDGVTFNNIGENYTQSQVVGGDIITTNWEQNKVVNTQITPAYANAAMANIDNSTRAGENNYSFNNPNYKPTPEQQNWYNFCDAANKTAAIGLAGAVALPALVEEVPIVANFLFNKGKDEIVQEISPNKSSPKPSPNFKTPTNPEQLPPANAPQGMSIRVMKPTEQYPNGYWVLEKPMPQGRPQYINPSTMKPGPHQDTHVPLPPGYWK